MSQDRGRKRDSVRELQSCEKLRFLWRSHIISGKNICKDGRVSTFFWRGFQLQLPPDPRMTGKGREWRVVVIKVRLPQGELLVDCQLIYESAMWFGWLKLLIHSQASLIGVLMSSRIRDLIVSPLHRDTGDTFLEYSVRFWNVTSSVLFCLGNFRIFWFTSGGSKSRRCQR